MLEKPYVLFGFQHYYPQGGCHDIHGRYNTREEAEAVGNERLALTGYTDSNRWDEYHVMDLNAVQVKITTKELRFG